MLIDIYFALDKLKEVKGKLAVLQSLVDSNTDLSQQQHIITVCKDIIEKLNSFCEMVGDLKTDRVSAMYRHLGFIMNQPSLARANLDEILRLDFPTIRNLLVSNIKELSFLHPVLQEACAGLYGQRHYTATIREAFAAWKDYACKVFVLPNTLDGHALIDQLFSRSGRARCHATDDMQVAFLEYCKSVYALFRNKLSHNAYQATPYDVDAALTGINLMLHHIDEAAAARNR